MCSRRIKVVVWAALAALAVGLLPVSGAGAAPEVRQGEFGACGDPATPIHDIQGTGERTSVGGQVFTIEGVVVGDYQDQNTEFGGFYIEEEAADADSDPLTSEGIFIDSKLSKVDVAAGDVVRVTGAAFELSDSGVSLTLLRRVKEILVCESGASVEPVEITLPVEAVADLERYEGMLVTFPQELTISEVYNLGRYGELLLSADGRLYEPTHIARPGDPALAVLADNARRSITLDDGNNQQNVDPTRYPVGGLSAANGVRDGDTTTGVTGVLDQRFGMYLIQPVGTFEITPSNPRPAEPPDVGGRIRVASFNVLNYFNGDGAGGGFPTARGADTPDEFTRQRDKIISAILALDADVIGLMEIVKTTATGRTAPLRTS